MGFGSVPNTLASQKLAPYWVARVVISIRTYRAERVAKLVALVPGPAAVSVAACVKVEPSIEVRIR